MTKTLQNSSQDKLAAKRFVITAEVTPPVSFDRAELIAKAMPLKGLADAVNLTDGAGARPHLGARHRRRDAGARRASSRSCNSPAATATALPCRAT